MDAQTLGASSWFGLGAESTGPAGGRMRRHSSTGSITGRDGLPYREPEEFAGDGCVGAEDECDDDVVRSTIEDEQLHGPRTLVVPDQDIDPQLPARRTVLLLSMSIAGMFVAKELGVEGIGPLGSIIAGTMASYMLGAHAGSVGSEAVEENVSWLWSFLQPLLFGLIGASVNLAELDPSYLGWGLVVVLLALVARSITAFLSVATGEFSYSEMLFIAVAWMPKATVQAAYAGIAVKQIGNRSYDNPDV